MKYHLRVYDNYHHGDESEAYDHGEYDTYEEAESAAKAIVNEFLEHNWSRGKTPGMLIAEYGLYGEDPVILPAGEPESRNFSAADYADEIAGSICLKLENRQKKKEVQTLYQEAIIFATYKHQEKGQKVKGTELPYVVHLSTVAMEILMASSYTKDFNLILAIQVALLHDTIEDTDATFDELKTRFGKDVATAVQALSKDEKLPKDNQISDSLARIKKLKREVWAVKLADRITNLQPAPAEWSVDKRKEYLKEAQMILDELGEGNPYLAERLKAKISEYRNQNKRYLLDGS
jgi:guanosine-3',5'-bis(diphosphate) 3'-pyrophosphohydrolase